MSIMKTQEFDSNANSPVFPKRIFVAMTQKDFRLIRVFNRQG